MAGCYLFSLLFFLSVYAETSGALDLEFVSQAQVNEEACENRLALACWLRGKQEKLYVPMDYCPSSSLQKLGKNISINADGTIVAFDPFAVAIMAYGVDRHHSQLYPNDLAREWFKRSCNAGSLLGCFAFALRITGDSNRQKRLKLFDAICRAGSYQACQLGTFEAKALGNHSLSRELKHLAGFKGKGVRRGIKIFQYASFRYQKLAHHTDLSQSTEKR